MTDYTAKKLAEAMNRLAAAIENATPKGMVPGGMYVWHHGPTEQVPKSPTDSQLIPGVPNIW